MKYPAFLLFILSCTFTIAQETGVISGKVRGLNTGESLISASISIDRSSGAITDTSGFYRLELTPGKHTLEFFYVGYENVVKEIHIEAGKEVTLNVGMKVSRSMLDEIVISAGKFEQKLSDITVSLDVIKSAQFSDQNIESLDEILEKTSGVTILNGQPSIRGGSGFSYGVGTRVLMLVDDMPMISGDAGDIKWNYIPVENINQVEIIKGASSVLYGSAALNGVINVRTRFPGIEPKTDITIFGGMYMEPERKELVWWNKNPKTYGASFSHLRKIGQLGLSVGGNYYKNEGYRELEHEERARANLSLKYQFKKIKGLTAGVNTSVMYLDYADFLFWQNADSGAYRQNADSYAPLFGHRFNMDPFIEYNTSGGDKHSLRSRLYSVGNGVLRENSGSYTKSWYGEYRWSNRIGEHIHWTSGVSFLRNTVTGDLFDDHQGTNAAIYTQFDAQLFSKLKLSTGVRWEMNALDSILYESKPVLRAGLNYQAGKATYIRTSFGQGYRFPSVAEMHAKASFNDFKIFANPELKPEHGWNAEIGVKQGVSVASLTGFADLALFWTEYNDMIEYNFGNYPPEGSPPAYQYTGFKSQNIENARIIGLETTIAGNGKLGPIGLDFNIGYTYMDPIDPALLNTVGRIDSIVLKYRRKHLFKSDVSLKFGKLQCGVNTQYNSRMINVDEAFSNRWLGELIMPGFPEYWRNKAGDYVLIDLRISYQVTSYIRMNAILRNAANKEFIGRPGDIGPPRSLVIQLKTTF